MTQNPKVFNLEERTLEFAKKCRSLIRQLPKNTVNFEDGAQLTRSSGSVGANYIEANEALSKKDLIMRMRISRKEAKESRYWLNLIETSTPELEKQRLNLIQESTELMNIFGSIIRKLEI